MLNIRISQTQFDALSEQERAHYVKNGDQFVLDVNGDTPAMTELRQQNVTLNNKLLSETTARQAADAKVAKADLDAEAKYKTQLDSQKEQITKMQSDAISARKDAIVNGIASKFDKASLFANTISRQVEVSYNEKGELVEKFVNLEGKEITLEALSDSYCKDPQYSAMLAKPVSTPTLPSNQPPAGQQPNPSFQPTFNHAPQGGQGGNAANWGMEGSKPVIYDYGKMTPAETSQYAAAKLAYDQSGATT